MTSGQKIAFSLLTAMVLFAGFVLGLRTKVFDELETRYYTQSKIEEYTVQLNKISESCDSYITEILTKLETGENAWAKAPSVRSFYLQNPAESDVNQRRLLTEQLFQQIPALNGIRIVDKNGRNVHYSSYDDTDILKQTGITKVYKNYPDIQKDADELAFEILEKKSDAEKTKLLLDEQKNRLIITVPYCWMDDVYAGQCLFYFRWSDVEKELTAREVIPVGQKLTMFTEDYNGGFAYGLPSGNKNQFKESLIKYLKGTEKFAANLESNKFPMPEKLLEIEDGRFWVALSNTNSSGLKICGVYTSDIFELSEEVVLIIYITVFVSLLLIAFLLFSFSRDPELVLKKRIKKIQYGIIKECIEKEGQLDWSYVSRQLKTRKKDLSSEIIKSLKVHSRKKRKELDAFLEQNWNEIFSVFEEKTTVTVQSNSVNATGVGELTGASLAEIRKVIEEVLQSTKINVAAVETVQPVSVKKTKTVAAPVPAVEDVEELDDVEEIEEIEDAEDIEEVEEIDDAEAVEEIEEIEDAEDIEEVEEIDDAEAVEEIEEIEDAEDIEEVEEIDDAEAVEEIEEIEDAEDIEEVEEVDDAETVEEIEEIEDAEDIEEVEEIDDAEAVEEIEEIEDTEDIEEVEEVDDAESVEEVEEAEAVEEINDAEEIEDADEIDDVEELEGVNESPVFSAEALLMSTPTYVYKPSKDTYFKGDEFATVENIFAEELGIGPHIKRVNDELDVDIMRFKIYELNQYPQQEPEVEEVVEVEEEIEELSEEIPSEKPYYSMINFAENLSVDTPVLEAADDQNGAIVESDGVYSISNGLELNGVKQDMDFKALVDSVL